MGISFHAKDLEKRAANLNHGGYEPDQTAAYLGQAQLALPNKDEIHLLTGDKFDHHLHADLKLPWTEHAERITGIILVII